MISLIEKIKRRIGQKLWIRKFPLTRKKKFLTYQQIKTMLILYDGTKSENREQIALLVDELQSAGNIKITSLGYEKGPHSAPMAPSASDSILLLRRSNFNFFYLPLPHAWTECMTQEYDLMMVLTHRSIFPLQLISKQINAKMKLGKSDLWDEVFDIMVSVPEAMPLNKMAYLFIEQIKMFHQKSN